MSLQLIEKENKELKQYIKFLGSISDTCTFHYTKEICEGCNCPDPKINARKVRRILKINGEK